MARLVTCGFEVQGVTTTDRTEGQGLVTDLGTPTIDTATKRSGNASARINAAPETLAWGAGAGLSVLNRFYRVRAYLNFDAFPSTATQQIIHFRTGPGVAFSEVRINPSGQIQCYAAGVAVGSLGQLTLNTWHRIELGCRMQSAANDDYELFLDGVSLASAQSAMGTVAPDLLYIGPTAAVAGTPATFWVDDVAMNDDTGASQTGRPGDGKIVLLKPVSDGTRVGWVGGAGGTVNLFSAVDNTPPIGVAVGAASTDLTQIEDATNNATDTMIFNCAAYTTALGSGGGGLGASDTVTLTQAVAAGGSASITSRTLAVRSESNPGADASEGTVATGTTTAGTWPAGWTTARGSVNYAPSLTLGNTAGVRIRKGTASTTAMTYGLVGLYVEYVPAAATTPVDGVPLDLVWDTRAAADGVPLDLKWDVVAQVNGIALDLLWDLRSPVDGSALDLIWDLRAQADGVPLDLLWDLRAQVDGAPLDLLWDLYAQVNGTPLDAVWDLRAAVDAGALDLIWDLAAGGGASPVDGAALDLLWDLVAQVNGPPLRLVWDVAAEAVTPPPPSSGGGGGGWVPPVRVEVDGRPLRLRWGVSEPGSALSDAASEPPTKQPPLPIPPPPRRAQKRKRAVDGGALVLRWNVAAELDAAPLVLGWALAAQMQGARLVLRWASSEDAHELARIRGHREEDIAKLKRLTAELEEALDLLEQHAATLEGERASARELARANGTLERDVERLRDDVDALSALLLSGD